MSDRGAAWVAWAACGLCFVLTALSLLLLTLNLKSPGVHIFTYWAEATVLTLAFSTIGAIIVSRRPEHPIGWLFCVIGLLAGIDHFCGEYAIYALLAHPGALPFGEAGAWVRSWVWVSYIGVGMFLVLLFPDGRLPSSRWRPFAWFVVTVVFLGAIALAANLWKSKESTSGKRSWPTLPTTPPSPSAIRCPCRRGCSPALIALPAFPWRGRELTKSMGVELLTRYSSKKEI